MTSRELTARNWPASEGPAERLLTQGAHALSDAELLALLIASGGAGAPALNLARRALSEVGGLAGCWRHHLC